MLSGKIYEGSDLICDAEYEDHFSQTQIDVTNAGDLFKRSTSGIPTQDITVYPRERISRSKISKTFRLERENGEIVQFRFLNGSSSAGLSGAVSPV
jgi:hypothetical protein